jgi:predicted RNA methylase
MGYPGSVKDRLMRRVRSWTRHILRPAVISIQDVRLAIDPTVMSPLMVQVLYDESYESVEREIVENHLDDDDTVLELGAGIGYIGVCAAKKIGPHRVFCVEPNPRLIPLIAENQRLNSIVFLIIHDKQPVSG